MKIVIVDDQEEIRYSVSKGLKKIDCETYLFSGLEFNIVKSIKEINPDLFIIDVMLSDSYSGIDLVKVLRQAGIVQPIVLMTAFTTPTNMIEASKIGIKDILQKPFKKEELLSVVQKYKKNRKVVVPEGYVDANFVGTYNNLKDVYQKIGISSNNDLAVIILGDTGTGKELVANLIHSNSTRSMHPFIAINCATIPKELFESELFGHEKGSFTGADKKHIGFAETVGGGTLFFDEIGELDFSIQSKLLRFLEEKSFKRVGGNDEIKFRGRVVSATNVDIKNQIQSDNFREDLFHRLSMITIQIPSLKDRLDDIPLLVNHFIKKANKDLKLNIDGISEEALEILQNRDFSGNVRELRNIVYNAMLNAYSSVIEADNLKFNDKKNKPTSLKHMINEMIELNGIDNITHIYEEIEKTFYGLLISKCNNISQLSTHLGISRSTLRKILNKYGIKY